jgi:hypothetical protein
VLLKRDDPKIGCFAFLALCWAGHRHLPDPRRVLFASRSWEPARRMGGPSSVSRRPGLRSNQRVLGVGRHMAPDNCWRSPGDQLPERHADVGRMGGGPSQGCKRAGSNTRLPSRSTLDVAPWIGACGRVRFLEGRLPRVWSTYRQGLLRQDLDSPSLVQGEAVIPVSGATRCVAVGAPRNAASP